MVLQKSRSYSSENVMGDWNHVHVHLIGLQHIYIESCYVISATTPQYIPNTIDTRHKAHAHNNILAVLISRTSITTSSTASPRIATYIMCMKEFLHTISTTITLDNIFHSYQLLIQFPSLPTNAAATVSTTSSAKYYHSFAHSASAPKHQTRLTQCHPPPTQPITQDRILSSKPLEQLYQPAHITQGHPPSTFTQDPIIKPSSAQFHPRCTCAQSSSSS